MSTQSIRVSNVFTQDVAKEWVHKGQLIREVQGCDNPILKELDGILQDGTEILEIGCGPGKLIEYIMGQVDECHVIGLDISKDMVEAAKQRVDNLDCKGNTVHFVVGDIEDYMIKPRTFDVIILKQVLHHLYNPVLVLTKIKEYLKPDGCIVLMVPSNNYQSEIFTFRDDEADVLGRFSIEGLENIIFQSTLFPVRLCKERFMFEFDNFYKYMSFMKDIGGIQKLFDYDQDKYSNVLKILDLYENLLVSTERIHISGEYIVAVCSKGEAWKEFHYRGVNEEELPV